MTHVTREILLELDRDAAWEAPADPRGWLCAGADLRTRVCLTLDEEDGGTRVRVMETAPAYAVATQTIGMHPVLRGGAMYGPAALALPRLASSRVLVAH